ncbi:hypothetical protein BGZ90_002002 [Linnemannia elongata]|nr:hypothetical protein BGZ90_002002 [Linnemannia elongata]
MSKYIIKTDAGKEEVQVDGFVTSDSIRGFQFVRSEMKDVTAAMAAKIGVTGKNTYVVPISLKYPDGAIAQRVLLCGNILQVRESYVTKSGESRYGNGYILLGIPSSIVEKLIHDMRNQSAVINTEKLPAQDGYHWVNVNIGGDDSKTSSIFKIIEGDSIKTVPITTLMDNMKRISTNNLVMHCWCELRLKCQTTHALNTIASHSEWNLGITMIDAYLVDVTPIQGPTVGALSTNQTYADDDFFNPSAGLSEMLRSLSV